VADWSGNSNYAYPAYPTRYRVQSLRRLVGKQGIIWLRLGSDPPKPEFENGAPGDLIVFARDVIGKLSGPVALITTDGDRTIPEGLPSDVVQKIVNDPNIKVWYSQNLVTPSSHPKLRSLPIGIDLHTPIGRLIRTKSKAELFRTAIKNSSTTKDRIPRVWSDVHLEPDLGDLVGEPRGLLTETRDELRDGINKGQLAGVIDSPTGRVSVNNPRGSPTRSPRSGSRWTSLHTRGIRSLVVEEFLIAVLNNSALLLVLINLPIGVCKSIPIGNDLNFG
jgi:hypothetical protein